MNVQVRSSLSRELHSLQAKCTKDMQIMVGWQLVSRPNSSYVFEFYSL